MSPDWTCPCFRKSNDPGILRDSITIRAMVRSATASAFLPGVLMTGMP